MTRDPEAFEAALDAYVASLQAHHDLTDQEVYLILRSKTESYEEQIDPLPEASP